MAFTTPFRNTWIPGDNSEWSGFWAFPQQYQILPASPSLMSHPAVPFINRVTLRPSDQPGVGGASGTFSALWHNLSQSTQHITNGDVGVFAFALRFASNLNAGGNVNSGTLFWELHNTQGFNVAPNNGDIGTIAPHAILAHAPDSRWTGSGFTSAGVDTSTVGLSLRIAAGDIHQGGVGTDRPQIFIPGLQPVPMDVWINFVLAYTFSESNTGRVRLWAVKSDSPQPSDFNAATPLLDITGVYTSDFDTNQPGVHDLMWTQMGAYTGDTNPPPLTTVDHTGEWVEATVANAITKLTTVAGTSGGGGTTNNQFVQTVAGINNTGSAVNTVAATPAHYLLGSDALVAVSWTTATSETCTVSDGLNTYTSISDPLNPVFDSTNSFITQWFLAKSVTSVGGSVTASFTGSRTYPSIVVTETSTANTGTVPELMKAAANVPGTAGADGISTGSGITATNGDYIAALAIQVGTGATSISAGTGFTLRASDTAYGLWYEDLTQATAGNIAGTWGSSAAAGKFLVSMVALKPITAATVPVVVNPPSISGLPLVGSTLTRVPATYSPAATSITGNWQLSADSISGWTNILGQAGFTYAPVAADVNQYARFIETPANGAGTGTPTTSNILGPITTPITPPGDGGGGGGGGGQGGGSGTSIPADQLVPSAYDVAINGQGYVFLDSVEPSLPFRSHRAIYDISQTFVERQNVSNGYGDQTQDFFLTQTQNDWSLGEGQSFFRSQDAASARRFYRSANLDVTVPGEATLRPKVAVIQGAAHSPGPVGYSGCSSSPGTTDKIFIATSTNLWSVSGTATDLGAHGLGTTPTIWSTCYDGANVYLAGPTLIRQWDGANFSTFSTSGANSVCFLNNTLFGASSTTLYKYSTSGTASVAFAFQNAVGGAGATIQKITPWGTKVAVILKGPTGPSVWTSDGTTAVRAVHLGSSFYAHDAVENLGVLYISGGFTRLTSAGGYDVKPAIMWTDGSSQGVLWQATGWTPYTATTLSTHSGFTPVSTGQAGLVFCDTTTSPLPTLMFYDLAAGGASSLGDFSYFAAASSPGAQLSVVASPGGTALIQEGGTSQFQGPYSGTAPSGDLYLSEIDFDSSLTKIFRGITVDFDPGTPPANNPSLTGSTGTVDVAYQLDGIGGTYTSLQTGVQSGQEVPFPAGSKGRTLSAKITVSLVNASTSPRLKRVAIRAAPVLNQFARATYIIDCTGTAAQPRQLRDGSYHPVPGQQQMKALLGVSKSRDTVQVTDRVHGTFQGLVDLSDAQGLDIYEVHPDPADPNKPGCYIVRVTLREV